MKVGTEHVLGFVQWEPVVVSFLGGMASPRWYEMPNVLSRQRHVVHWEPVMVWAQVGWPRCRLAQLLTSDTMTQV